MQQYQKELRTFYSKMSSLSISSNVVSRGAGAASSTSVGEALFTSPIAVAVGRAIGCGGGATVGEITSGSVGLKSSSSPKSRIVSSCASSSP